MIFNSSEHIEVKETPNRGKSLFAKHNFKKDEVVFVAYGKIIRYATDYTIPISFDLYITKRYWKFGSICKSFL